jgi:uncharacterized protein with PIN domain
MTDGTHAPDNVESDESTPAVRANDRLVLDVMLGKLATYLRMCGYDTVYALDREVEADDRILAIARAERRTLLTRDRELGCRTDDSVLLTTRAITDQLRELQSTGFRLELSDRPTRAFRLWPDCSRTVAERVLLRAGRPAVSRRYA